MICQCSYYSTNLDIFPKNFIHASPLFKWPRNQHLIDFLKLGLAEKQPVFHTGQRHILATTSENAPEQIFGLFRLRFARPWPAPRHRSRRSTAGTAPEGPPPGTPSMLPSRRGGSAAQSPLRSRLRRLAIFFHPRLIKCRDRVCHKQKLC